MKKIKILVVGCGYMGNSHGLAYNQIDDFEIVGVVNRSSKRRQALSKLLGGVSEFSDYDRALAKTKPDAVSINTYPDTHCSYSIKAMEAGAHVFVEKPLAETVEDAIKVINTAKKYQKQLVIGYILRHHPSWTRFIDEARKLGSPLVMRMNLNQQSAGKEWAVHKKLMNSLSPIVDCGVHYIDIMCQMTKSKPVRVGAIGARLSHDIDSDMYNYGQLQVTFENGSIGWYEAGWGPMMSENAYFIKDVIGPGGSVSMLPQIAKKMGKSSNIDTHTSAETLHIHSAAFNTNNEFAQLDEFLNLTEEPDHQELCYLEQLFFLRAVKEKLNLSEHHFDAINSLKVVLAADKSIRKGKVIELD